MKETDLVPITFLIHLVSKAEEVETWHLITSVNQLETFTQAFRYAVELFNFADLQIQLARDERNTANDWLLKSKNLEHGNIWPQEMALQINHLGIVMGQIRSQLRNTPSIRALVNTTMLRTAVKLFESYFPHNVLIRDASAHSQAELAPNESAFRSQALNGRLLIECLADDKYMITKDKRIALYQMSEATYEKLETVRVRFLTGFNDARVEVVKRGRRSMIEDHAGK